MSLRRSSPADGGASTRAGELSVGGLGGIILTSSSRGGEVNICHGRIESEVRSRQTKLGGTRHQETSKRAGELEEKAAA